MLFEAGNDYLNAGNDLSYTGNDLSSVNDDSNAGNDDSNVRNDVSFWAPIGSDDSVAATFFELTDPFTGNEDCPLLADLFTGNEDCPPLADSFTGNNDVTSVPNRPTTGSKNLGNIQVELVRSFSDLHSSEKFAQPEQSQRHGTADDAVEESEKSDGPERVENSNGFSSYSPGIVYRSLYCKL